MSGINLSAAGGEIVTLIGPNGAGKSTLLRCILGYLEPDEGSVELFGREPDHLESRKRISYAPETFHPPLHITAQEYLSLHCALTNIPGDEEKSINKLIKDFEIPAGKKIKTFSKGMIRKLSLTSAFLIDSKLIFLDEPTADLDPPSVFYLRKLLQEKRKGGTAFLINSHHLSEVEKTSDRALFIDSGEIKRQINFRKCPDRDLEKTYREIIGE